ncbi:hypothetical protein GGI20_005662 [Coemansia sp. BCRC 34301]|nr:hypothetical protein GGI20_005662 [Coemansia sp. BCRC 34301]
MNDCERTLRELDTIVQEWTLVHRRSTSAASQLHNLHDQSTKTQSQISTASSGSQPIPRLQLLLAMQISEIEAQLSSLRSHVHDYGSVIRRFESLDERVGQQPLVDQDDDGVYRVVGITAQYVVNAVSDRRAEYTKEYARRRQLIGDLVIREKIGIAQFSSEWMEAKVDYAVEEDYLERLRLARMARQWQANCAESERLITK